MAVVWTDIRDLPSGEFSTLTQGQIDPFIARAKRRVNEGHWGDQYDDGVMYMTAHLLALSRRPSSAAGVVVSETVGSMSRSYAAPTSGDLMQSTSYGQVFADLSRDLISTPVVC